MFSNSHAINKTNIVTSIENNNSISIKENKNFEYSSNQEIFDPTKNSPPNIFMLKLYYRLFIYENYRNDDNVERE